MSGLFDGVLDRDVRLLLAAKAVRNLGNGLLLVGLALYLAARGLSPAAVGLLFTVALASGAVGGVLGARVGRRRGRRAVLAASAALMAAAAGVLALAPGLPWALLGAALGALSPSGQEVGAFAALEQAALSGLLPQAAYARAFAWYNLGGSLAAAAGALLAGLAPAAAGALGWAPGGAPLLLILAYAAAGLVLLAVYLALGPAVEGPREPSPAPGRAEGQPGRPGALVARLTVLFGVDALAGGLVVQSLVAYWLHLRFGLGLEALGIIFSATNLLAAASYLGAARIAERFGLLNTMVFTHLPSNVLLALLPWAPTWPVAAALLIARSSVSRMDVPTRQAYTMAIVPPEERSAAAGWTNAVRPAAAAVAPLLTGAMFATAASGLPFVLAGGLKAAYDLSLFGMFRRVRL